MRNTCFSSPSIFINKIFSLNLSLFLSVSFFSCSISLRFSLTFLVHYLASLQIHSIKNFFIRGGEGRGFTYIKKNIYSYKFFPQNINLYCRGKGPRSYIGPQVLSDDRNRSKNKQVIMKYSQTKFRKKRENEWLSEEYILLGLNEYSSKYIIQQLK